MEKLIRRAMPRPAKGAAATPSPPRSTTTEAGNPAAEPGPVVLATAGQPTPTDRSRPTSPGKSLGREIMDAVERMFSADDDRAAEHDSDPKKWAAMMASVHAAEGPFGDTPLPDDVDCAELPAEPLNTPIGTLLKLARAEALAEIAETHVIAMDDLKSEAFRIEWAASGADKAGAGAPPVVDGARLGVERIAERAAAARLHASICRACRTRVCWILGTEEQDPVMVGAAPIRNRAVNAAFHTGFWLHGINSDLWNATKHVQNIKRRGAAQQNDRRRPPGNGEAAGRGGPHPRNLTLTTGALNKSMSNQGWEA